MAKYLNGIIKYLKWTFKYLKGIYHIPKYLKGLNHALFGWAWCSPRDQSLLPRQSPSLPVSKYRCLQAWAACLDFHEPDWQWDQLGRTPESTGIRAEQAFPGVCIARVSIQDNFPVFSTSCPLPLTAFSIVSFYPASQGYIMRVSQKQINKILPPTVPHSKESKIAQIKSKFRA